MRSFLLLAAVCLLACCSVSVHSMSVPFTSCNSSSLVTVQGLDCTLQGGNYAQCVFSFDSSETITGGEYVLSTVSSSNVTTSTEGTLASAVSLPIGQGEGSFPMSIGIQGLVSAQLVAYDNEDNELLCVNVAITQTMRRMSLMKHQQAAHNVHSRVAAAAAQKKHHAKKSMKKAHRAH